MTRGPFDPAFEDLPASLPVFPLPGVLLLPGGRLPLNVFETRYLAMVRTALEGPRLIGMLQPRLAESGAQGEEDVGSAELYRTGCAGRIVAFSETDDGRYLVTLAGLLRFDVLEELPASEGYRRVRPDWSPFREDLEAAPASATARVDRDRLLAALKSYFAAKELSGDWESIERAPSEPLVTQLAMACPFEPSEKQALLEAPGLVERAHAMTAMLELAAHPDQGRLRH